jgi:hypothetical protein
MDVAPKAGFQSTSRSDRAIKLFRLIISSISYHYLRFSPWHLSETTEKGGRGLLSFAPTLATEK